MKKNRKKIILFIAFIWLLVSIYIIQITYSKYLTQINNTTNVMLSSWNIKLNNQNITQNSTISEVLAPTFPETTYIEAGKIVPGAIGYFDLEIDSTAVTMPFSYLISIEKSDIFNEISDLVVSGYSFNNGAIIPITSDVPITGTVSPIENVSNIRIYVSWDEGENSTLSDVADTDISLNEGEFYITTNITFDQLAATNP